MLRVRPYRDLDLAEKVAYLRRPDPYPDAPAAVEAIETHFAWVFLSRCYVYKLKKPVRFPDLDLRSVEARRANCELEVALNRRLAAETYIGVVPLGRQGLRPVLECDRYPMDWLVKMIRLSRATTLERLLPVLDAGDPRLPGLLDILTSFYARAARAPWTGAAYLGVLERQCAQNAARLDLIEPEQRRIATIAERQLAYLGANRGLLERRAEDGRVCDAHGDLRPEHIFLTERPQIIDCLEFSSALRLLDAAEEISFLALECERLGRPDIGERIRALYVETAADDVPHGLFEFYRSRRALVRAYLSAWHLEDGLDEASATRWLDQARWYVGEAARSMERAWPGPATRRKPRHGLREEQR